MRRIKFTINTGTEKKNGFRIKAEERKKDICVSDLLLLSRDALCMTHEVFVEHFLKCSFRSSPTTFHTSPLVLPVSFSNFSSPCISCYPIWPNLPPLIPPLSPPSVVYNGMSSKIWSAVFLKVTEPSKESQPKCCEGSEGGTGEIVEGRAKKRGREIRGWRSGECREGKEGGLKESSAVMEERNGGQRERRQMR